jgi:hypothetical protein
MVKRLAHPTHTPRRLTPLLQLILKMMKTMKQVEKKVKMMSRTLLKTSPTPFWCLMTKGEKI